MDIIDWNTESDRKNTASIFISKVPIPCQSQWTYIIIISHTCHRVCCFFKGRTCQNQTPLFLVIWVNQPPPLPTLIWEIVCPNSLWWDRGCPTYRRSVESSSAEFVVREADWKDSVVSSVQILLNLSETPQRTRKILKLPKRAGLIVLKRQAYLLLWLSQTYNFSEFILVYSKIHIF